MEPMISEGGGGSSGDFFDVIPVFTVLKKGAAIKNVFLHCPVSPRSSCESATTSSCGATTPGASGVRFLVGRHPDCHVVLDHPSVSRFHVELLARPALRRLTLTDLSSAHGTWICGRRLEPRQPVDLQEGDVLKFGASTRVYVLRWVALGGTDGSSNPLALGPLLEEDKAEEEEKFEAAAAVTDKEQQQEDDNPLFLLENPNHLLAEPNIHLALLMPEPVVFSSLEGFPSLISSEENEGQHDEAGRKKPRQEEELIPQKEDEGEIEPKKKVEEQSEAATDNPHRQKDDPDEQEIPNWAREESVIPSAPLMPESLALSSPDESPGSEDELIPQNDDEEEIEPKKEEEEQSEAAADNPHGQKDDHDELEIPNCAQEESVIPSASLMPESLLLSSPDESPGSEEELIPQKEDEEEIEPKKEEEEQSEAAADNPHRQKDDHDEQEIPNCAQEESMIPSAPRMPESLVSSSPDESPGSEEELIRQNEDEEEIEPKKEEEEQSDAAAVNPHRQKDDHDEQDIPNCAQEESVVPSAPLMPQSLALSTPNESPGPFEEEVGTASRKELQGEEAVAPQKGEEQPPQRLDTDGPLSGLLSRRSKTASLLRVRTGRSCEKSDGLSKVLFSEKEPRDEEEGEEIYPSDKENLTPVSHPSWKLKKPSASSVMRCASDSNQRSVDKKNCVQVGLLSENGENANSSLKLQNAVSSRRILKENKPDKENQKKKLPSDLNLTEHSNITEEDNITSDKKNRLPMPSNGSKSKESSSSNRQRIESAILKRKAAERVPFLSLLDSPITKLTSLCSSNGENSPANGSGTGKEISACRKGERAPFQTLVDKSVKKPNHSSADNARFQTIKAPSFATNCCSKGVTQRKKKWSIVVDVGCLTDEESLRSLQLLEGIRGTSLVIPLMVIRELDYQKRTESLFRKTATRASAILEWIKECMVKTSWWIHVQSSGEITPVAPTPPGTPRSKLDEMMMGICSENTTTSCSDWGGRRKGLSEIVSPTAEDHILGCALLFRKMRPDDQTVLLSNSVSLNIKAMAEGLLCETARDFRESLVNPSSERFLWVDSSPRGPTWSLAEEAASYSLAEKQNHQLLAPAAVRRGAAGGGGKPPTTEGAKGLKLILLHKLHYGKLSTLS